MMDEQWFSKLLDRWLSMNIRERNDMKKRATIILHITIMGLIIWFSSRTAIESSGQSGFVLKLLSFIMGIESVEALDAETYSFYQHMIRKLAHLTIYGVLGILTYTHFISWHKDRSKMMKYSIVFCICFAISDEVHQYFVPGRAMMLKDVMIDTVGASLGIVVISWLVGWLDRSKGKE